MTILSTVALMPSVVLQGFPDYFALVGVEKEATLEKLRNNPRFGSWVRHESIKARFQQVQGLFTCHLHQICAQVLLGCMTGSYRSPTDSQVPQDLFAADKVGIQPCPWTQLYFYLSILIILHRSFRVARSGGFSRAVLGQGGLYLAY